MDDEDTVVLKEFVFCAHPLCRSKIEEGPAVINGKNRYVHLGLCSENFESEFFVKGKLINIKYDF
jgi:hypothetical protein